jgi:uncharacterized protein involved in exopolysaccharide biosynthesis
MEFHGISRILVRRKRLLIWLPLVAMCVGLGLAYVLPEQYESTALVIVRPFEDIKFNSSDADKKGIPAFPASLTAPVDAPSKTYMEVIKSPAVAIKVVEALRLDVKKPKKTDGWIESLQEEGKAWARGTLRAVGNYIKYGREIPASAFDLAVEDVERNLVVAARKDTYAFAITYRAGDPKEAAAVANKAAEIFLERSSEAYRSESARAREFIETQVRESRQALEHARADTMAYKKSGGTFELTTEYNEKLRNISDLENTLAKTEGRLAGRRLVDARARIKYSPVATATNAEIAELKGQILSLRLQLASYPSKETKLNDIRLAERIAEQNYEFYRKQYEEARVKESATVTEIRIVSRAVPTLYPVKPLKFVYAGMSFATAMVLAIGWALFFGARDPRIRQSRGDETDSGGSADAQGTAKST